MRLSPIQECVSSCMRQFVLLFVLILTGCRAVPPPSVTPTASRLYTNPLLESGADPWVVQDGTRFHYCYSRGGRAIYVKTVTDITELPTAEEVLLWDPPAGTDYSQEIWAPELHKIGDRWYVYFAADDGDNANHRMHALVSNGSTIAGGFTYAGELTTPSDKWAIDGTVLSLRDTLYFVWSGWRVTSMSASSSTSPAWTLPFTYPPTGCSSPAPQYAWERAGSSDELPTINEGPQVLERNGTVHLVYSAAGSWSDDYCLGMLTLSVGASPLEAAAWRKSPEPVFAGTDCVISPGPLLLRSVGRSGLDRVPRYPYPRRRLGCPLRTNAALLLAGR